MENSNTNDTHKPLVSVVVVTYNSSSTVLETLESIKTQTYENIELIITDDKSSDNTVQVCAEWLNENKIKFVYNEIVTADVNTGVSGNLNRGIRQSHGEWIKSIAGDDLLIPTAIEEYVRFVTESPDKIRMCVCDVKLFTSDGNVPQNLIDRYSNFFKLEQEKYEDQRKRVMTSLVFVGPAYFYSRELFDEIGGYSERYGNAEEWPFAYKIIMAGNQIHAIPKRLVRYRVQSSSLCNVKDDKCLPNKSVFMGMYHHFFDHPFKDLVKEGQLLTAFDISLMYWSRRLQYHFNKHGIRKAIHIIFMMFSPLSYVRKYKSLEKK